MMIGVPLISKIRPIAVGLIAFLSVLAVWGVDASAQTSTTPGTAPGAPAGSYALSDIESINLFNGKLGFHLPLIHVGGRGTAGYTIVLNNEANWHIDRMEDPPNTPFDNPENGDSSAIFPGYGPGVIYASDWVYLGPIDCAVGGSGPTTAAYGTLTKLTFVGQNGTEYELIDALREGQEYTGIYGCSSLLPS